ncbi:MAG: type II toxin-antitoxin system VapC family toxin [Bryobacteraceae bacterium]
MYLVDTDVVSAAAPTTAAGPPPFAAWMDAQSLNLFLSAVSIAEIEDGIAKLRREGATKKARDLAAWIDTLVHLYTDRVLVFDLGLARIAGRVSDKARGLGLTPGFADIIIAATALHHGLVLLTRNTRDFLPLGVKVHDPFVSLPG